MASLASHAAEFNRMKCKINTKGRAIKASKHRTSFLEDCKIQVARHSMAILLQWHVEGICAAADGIKHRLPLLQKLHLEGGSIKGKLDHDHLEQLRIGDVASEEGYVVLLSDIQHLRSLDVTIATYDSPGEMVSSYMFLLWNQLEQMHGRSDWLTCEDIISLPKNGGRLLRLTLILLQSILWNIQRWQRNQLLALADFYLNFLRLLSCLATHKLSKTILLWAVLLMWQKRRQKGTCALISLMKAISTMQALMALCMGLRCATGLRELRIGICKSEAPSNGFDPFRVMPIEKAVKRMPRLKSLELEGCQDTVTLSRWVLYSTQLLPNCNVQICVSKLNECAGHFLIAFTLRWTMVFHFEDASVCKTWTHDWNLKPGPNSIVAREH